MCRHLLETLSLNIQVTAYVLALILHLHVILMIIRHSLKIRGHSVRADADVWQWHRVIKFIKSIRLLFRVAHFLIIFRSFLGVYAIMYVRLLWVLSVIICIDSICVFVSIQLTPYFLFSPNFLRWIKVVLRSWGYQVFKLKWRLLSEFVLIFILELSLVVWVFS